MALALAMGVAVPLLLLKGCEAALFFQLDNVQTLADVPSPDGQLVLVVRREPGMDGDAQHDILLRPKGAEKLERLGVAGDLAAHDVIVLWSDDSTVASVWLDGVLSYVYDRMGRNPTPVEVVGRPTSLRPVSRAELAVMVRELQAGKSPWALPPATAPVTQRTSPPGTPGTAAAQRRAP